MKVQEIRTLFHFGILVISFILLFACKKTESPNPDPNSSNLINASIAGRVTDINNVPVSRATVTAGTSTTTTDINGQFLIQNAGLIKDAGFVKVTKAGYFSGSRTFLVSGNAVNNMRIALIPKTITGNFAAGSGGKINLQGGGDISFVASSVIDATTNGAYTGDVSVSTFYLNPADGNFNDYMPGNLVGMNASNQQKILQSFGMVSVELNNAAGEKLQLAAGKTSTISIPIPAAMQANAPATIPLWYFDETKGIWKEEGNATRQGNNYVGTVAHFSFWTPGQLGQNIRLDATFKDQNGAVLANKLVTITSPDYGTTNGYTDSAGTVSGLVPATETLILKIPDACGGTSYSKSIGPFSTDTNLGIISITLSASNNITLSGKVVNCSNAAVTNGYVQVNIGSDHFNSAITNGDFAITFSHCNNLIAPDSITAFDMGSNLHSVPMSINGINGNQNIGQLTACALSTSPIAGFTYSMGGSVLPITVIFANTSTNALNYYWDFGDGTTSTLENTTHIYSVSGDYTIKLVATGAGGTNSTTQTIHIGSGFTVTDSSYINLTLNNVNYLWAYPDSVSAAHVDSSGASNSTQIQAGTGNKWMNFFILNDNTSPGNYNISLSMILNGISYPSNSAGTTVNVYGLIGGYVIGTASGQVRALDSTTNIPFTMSYKVKRVQ